MDKETKFKRTIFQKFPWLNLGLTILVTIIEIAVAVFDAMRGNYFWMVFFILISLIYVFLIIPMSYKLMRKTMQNNKDMKDLEKRINEIRKEWM